MCTVGVAWVLWGGPATDADGVSVSEAFRVDSIKQKLGQPDEMMKLFSSRQYVELTDEQREQVRRNKGQAYFQTLQQQVDKYFEAGEAEREEILDRHLDEFMTERDRSSKADEAKQDQQRAKSRKRPMTREQRKAKSESADPDDMARLAAYWTALKERARARGIK